MENELGEGIISIFLSTLQVPAFELFRLSAPPAAAGGVGPIFLWQRSLQRLPASTRWAQLRDGGEGGWAKDYISHKVAALGGLCCEP